MSCHGARSYAPESACYAAGGAACMLLERKHAHAFDADERARMSRFDDVARLYVTRGSESDNVQ